MSKNLHFSGIFKYLMPGRCGFVRTFLRTLQQEMVDFLGLSHKDYLGLLAKNSWILQKYFGLILFRNCKSFLIRIFPIKIIF